MARERERKAGASGKKRKAFSHIFKRVLENIRPDSKVVERCSSVVHLIDSEIKKKGIKAKAMLGGSIAKDTFLRDDYDCDVFVKFDYKFYRDRDISKILKGILKGFRPKTINGSRDYFQFVREGIKFEVVPVLAIRNAEEAVNIMDVSPLHVEWIKKRIWKNPKLTDEVRLARAFFKANKIYGAESFVRGFSGHVIDILTIYYGGFLKLLMNASRWEKKKVIDPENYHKGRALFNLNASKTEGPLVLVDPVQPDRNASASVSMEKFDMLVRTAGEFLKNPSERFFKEKMEIEKEYAGEYQKQRDKLFLLKVGATAYKGREDVVGCKLLKVFEFISERLEQNDFPIIKRGWDWDGEKKAFFYYLLDKKALKKTSASKYIIVKGPPAGLKEHAKRFRKKHQKVFVEGDILFARVRRKFLKPEQLINHLMMDKYLLTKVKEIKIVKS